MDYGLGLPTRGPLAKPEAIIALAQRSEELGFRYLGVSDHIVIPKDISSRYPYSKTGEFSTSQPGDCLEQLTLLSFLASLTSTARLLTSVMVLPHRNPVHVAKVLASIDVLSKGRLTLGCGVGWMREEFEAIGAPPYDDRGAVGDEYIRAFKELWTSDNPSFAGKYCRFSDVVFLPKPVQKPHPPIWVGGESPRALRRVAQLGDGWYPIGSNPRFPLQTVAQYSQAVDRLRRYTSECGRDPSKLVLAYSAGWYNEGEARHLADGQRQSFTGTFKEIAGDIRAFREVGVGHLILNFQSNTLDETLERMDNFAKQIIPAVEG